MNQKTSILIVDDKPEQLTALAAALEDLDLDVVKALSGRLALRHILEQEFAVILLDVNMPGLDGFETAAVIRQRQRSQSTPIIFITGLSDEMHVARGYSLGAVDYILAPVVPDVLRTKVTVFVELHRKSAHLERQAAWLKERASQLQKLNSASLAISGAPSLEDMLQAVADAARDIINANHAAATAAPGNGLPAFSVVSLSDKQPRWGPAPRPAALPDLQALVCHMQQPMRLTESELERRDSLPRPCGNLEGNAPVRGFLAAPLTRRDGGNMGLVQVYDKKEGDFNQDDEAILIQLAQMASLSIENTLFAQAREANRLKDEFLATLSHELRTPLHAIQGWTQLLRMKKLPPAEATRALEVIEQNARAQTRLIEDLLDVSRITSGKFRLNIREISLGTVIKAAIDSLSPAAELKGVIIPPASVPSPDKLVADPDRLLQVIKNLLSNAVKFTPRDGRVEVNVERANSHFRIQVRDSGAGISADFLPYVFERFRQADCQSTRKHGGLGIGLAIVRHLVELHGGKVKVESEGEGQGAVFTIDLPIKPRVPAIPGTQQTLFPAAAPEAGPDALRGLHILVVEDNKDARDLLAGVLEEHRATVTGVASVAEALTFLDRATADVLVSDIAMPGEDGYCLIRKVRERAPGAGGRIPALALTAYVGEEDGERALAAGFNQHAGKPVQVLELVAQIAQLAGRTPAPPAPPTRAKR